MRHPLVHFNCSICTSITSPNTTRGVSFSSTNMVKRSTTPKQPLVPGCPSFLLVPGGLVGSFPSHLLWILLILLLAAADAGINQTGPVAMPISSAKMGSVLGVPLHHGSSSSGGGGNGAGGGSSNTLINNNNSSSTGNFSDLGDSPFENNTFTSTTVPIGDTAFLKCAVKNLGNRTISWIRRRDMHIITVDRIVYTNDERFNILHVDGSDDWTLQIKFVQRRDNGTYECQVSSGKGISSFAVHVFVVVPEAFILGNGEYHIQQGSTINLVCIVEKSPKPPEYIFWFHNDRMINYGSTRDLTIQTETGSKTQSRLIIENAQVTDSGNYTCQTANAEPASTLVYISQGDKMAAIQRRKSDGSSSNTSPIATSSAALPSSSLLPNPSNVAMKIRALLGQLLLLLFQYSSISPYFTSFVYCIIATILSNTTTTISAFVFITSILSFTHYIRYNFNNTTSPIIITTDQQRVITRATTASSLSCKRF